MTTPVHPPHRGSFARRAAGAVGAIVVVVAFAACSSAPTTEVSTGDPGQVSTNPIPGSVVPPSSTSIVGASTVTTGPATTAPDPVVDPPVGSSTSIPAAVSVPVTAPLPPDPSIETQVFWVRGPADDRIVDLPGYQEPASGPKPLVLYGSVTNVGSSAVVNPFVTATWLDSSGEAQAAFTTSLLAPGSTNALGTLEPGAIGDVIVIISDPDVIAGLVDLAAELRLGSQ